MSQALMFRTILKSLDATIDDSGWQFIMESDTAVGYAAASDLIDHITNFLNVAGTGGTNALSGYIAPVMSRAANASTVEVYDITGHLDGSRHGSPVAMGSFTLGASNSSSPVPEGCAATISFRSDYGTDVEFGVGTRPRARDRNRVYFGPISNFGLVADTATHRCKFNAQFIVDALAALFSLSNDVTSSGFTYTLKVWSRKDAALKLPTEGWLDDRPDYQRRRSDPNPSSRVLRALASV